MPVVQHPPTTNLALKSADATTDRFKSKRPGITGARGTNWPPPRMNGRRRLERTDRRRRRREKGGWGTVRKLQMPRENMWDPPE